MTFNQYTTAQRLWRHTVVPSCAVTCFLRTVTHVGSHIILEPTRKYA